MEEILLEFNDPDIDFKVLYVNLLRGQLLIG